MANIGYKLPLIAAGTREKHCYTAGEFYQTVVTQMAQDTHGKIRAPYFETIDLLAGGSTNLYIVPTVSGSYNVACAAEGNSEAEITGTVIVE